MIPLILWEMILIFFLQIPSVLTQLHKMDGDNVSDLELKCRINKASLLSVKDSAILMKSSTLQGDL